MNTPILGAQQTQARTAQPIDAMAIVGPTASGKTAAALALAESLQDRGGVEIISVDSALVYRGMDIGTAKPSRSELAAVPHHLIDTLDPLDSYSAAEFAKDATRLIRDIRARGKTPLLVGGTMLAQVDPITATRLAPGDSQRIGRALEVWTSTGQTLSSFHQSAKADAPNWRIPVISLEPSDRAWLHQRIAQRFTKMMAQGFLDEVRQLKARSDLNPDLPSMRCVGYRQAWEGLDGAWPESDIHERGIFATRQLAKRQITWLRSMPDRHVVQADGHQPLAQVQRIALESLR
jgi:tRNA dimethylallyltransferase